MTLCISFELRTSNNHCFFLVLSVSKQEYKHLRSVFIESFDNVIQIQ